MSCPPGREIRRDGGIGVIELAYAGDLTNPDELAWHLSTIGLSKGASESRARLFAKAMDALTVVSTAHRERSSVAFFVPGRIEVLGKHTDYAGGRSLVAAAERGYSMVAQPRDDSQMTVIDARNGETIRFRVDRDLAEHPGAWSNYPMRVARRIAMNFPGAHRGADIAFVSDLPPGAGMGGSSALMIGVFLVLSEVNRLPARDEYWHNIGNNIGLAGYLGSVKSGQSFGKLGGDPDARPRRAPAQ